MSGIERGRDLQEFGTIVVIGGGCYGSWYVRQLRRARTAGAIAWERVLVIDRDAGCRVTSDLPPGVNGEAIELVPAAWSAFLEHWLGDLADQPDREAGRRDAIVPSPLMPHLLFDWILTRARQRWPDRAMARVPLDSPPPVPWQRASPGGTHYVSFAEWMCPVNCIEPRRCPVTRGPRDWSLPVTLRSYADAERVEERSLVGPLIFHCTHRAYGVGMIDVRDVLDADRAVAGATAGTSGPVRVLVGTTSHCHGALDLVTIGGATP